jgi:hypothetical protein
MNGPAPDDGPAPTRVLIVGCPGAGKSTLARELGAAVGLPVHHLDDEYWGPDWSRPDPAVWLDRLRGLTETDQWIIDGNYLPTAGLRAQRATVAVLVDAPTARCVVRVLRRAWRIRRGARAALPAQVRGQAAAGQRVAAGRDLGGLIALVLRYNRSGRWRMLEEIRAAGDARLLVCVPFDRRGRRRPLVRGLALRAITAQVVHPQDLPGALGRHGRTPRKEPAA